MTDRCKYFHQMVSALSIFLALSLAVHAEPTVTAKYLYTLSNFSGAVPVTVPSISIDESAREVYVATGDAVRVFNEQGMEVYRFGSGDTVIRNIYDVAVLRDGTILLLSYFYDSNKNYSPRIERCNYRGEPSAMVELQGVPTEHSGFRPTRILYRGGLLYLADLSAMKIVVISEAGEYRDAYDLAALIGIGEQQDDAGMFDFSVDREGAILFTSPVLGRAYRIAQDRKVEVFGKRGSTPGRFGIPTSVISDDAGRYYVSDSLRCVIIVFDHQFNFITEFGARGRRPENLIGPRSLALDSAGRLYIAQLGKRGVSVYRIASN